MKKLLILLSISTLLLASLGASALTSAQTQSAPRQESPSKITFEDELDQSVTSPDGVLPIGAMSIDDNATYVNISAAQSFIPQKNVLTRVLMLMAKNVTTAAPCTCDLRENLTGETLASVNVNPDQFPVFNPANLTENITWIEFDFYSVQVTPGNTYYLVIYTANVTDNIYYIAANESNNYPNGSTFFSFDNGDSWEEFTSADACFQTYGVQETVLAVTLNKGLLGHTFAIKNIGNYTAGSVVANISVEGGLLGLVHGSNLNIFSDINPGDEVVARTGTILGLGPITITVDVFAINAREQIMHVNATLILFFWIPQ